jgi:hypothetical protein
MQWKEEKQQLKKKKKEEAKVEEEDFCYCKASALFGYSFGPYFTGGKVECMRVFFLKELIFFVIESLFIT